MDRRAHQQEDVGLGHVFSDRARRAGPVDQPFEIRMQGITRLGDPVVAIAGRHKKGQIVSLTLVGGDGQELQQCRARIRRVRQLESGFGEHGDMPADDGGDEILFGREVSKHGAFRHPGTASDVGHRRCDATFGELVLGGGQQ
jgi:hypothetical protein